MERKYTYPKKKFDKKEIKKIEIAFDNGDYFSFDGAELVDLSVELYDSLVYLKSGYCFAAKGGFVKLCIKDAACLKSYNISGFVSDMEAFKNDRKAYIEKRCKEGTINSVCFFDENNWGDIVLCAATTKRDGECLTIEFCEIPHFRGFKSKHHSVMIGDVKREFVDAIDLDFENCDDFTVYKNEIKDLQFVFEDELDCDGWRIHRNIKSGYLVLRLDKTITFRHENVFYTGKERKSVKKLTERICGKKGKGKHDICKLDITYNCGGTNGRRSEYVRIDDIRSECVMDILDAMDEAEAGYLDYVGGYSEVLWDGDILITFGKDAKKLRKVLRKQLKDRA